MDLLGNEPRQRDFDDERRHHHGCTFPFVACEPRCPIGTYDGCVGVHYASYVSRGVERYVMFEKDELERSRGGV